MEHALDIALTVNDVQVSRRVPARQHLVDFLRDELGLTGSHVGCEHGVCGACTVLVDGYPARACLMLAVQADGTSITTVEGLATTDELHPIQEAFWDAHGLQCGFCTPGMLMAAQDLLRKNRKATREEIRSHISGNYCRCTGYQAIVDAIEEAMRTEVIHGKG